jgi:hypothetical protein
MEPTSAALMAGGSLLGGLLRNKQAKAASARQMAFQREMSNTSYQRGMEDMKKAGLNPILAGKMGGASTPTGSTYNPENVAVNTVNSYLQTKQNEANVDNINAQTNKLEAETRVINQSDNSIIGRNVEYGLKKLKQTYKGITQSEAVNEILKQSENLYNYSAKQLNELKDIINQKADEIFNINQTGVRIRVRPGGIIMPNGTIKKVK